MRFSRSATIEVEDLGRLTYAEATTRMEEVLAELAADPEAADRLLLAEFEPVLTLGRASTPADEAFAADLAIPIYKVARGGKATFHGPGQLVVYPIMRLLGEARDLHAYLGRLERALAATVADFGLLGATDSRNTGCWVNQRKIASIGVAVRRWVAYHGAALNVATDMSWFRRFDPCGLASATSDGTFSEIMTSMAIELGAPPDLTTVKATLAARFCEALQDDND
jgi:lipoyl(octanoyl) transferase